MATRKTPEVTVEEELEFDTQITPNKEIEEELEFDTLEEDIQTKSEFTLDDLQGFTINHDVDNAAMKELTAPAGDYLKEAVWEPRVTFKDEDTHTADLCPEKGRMIITFFGKAGFTKDKDIETSLFLRISPDKRRKKDDASKWDLLTRTYLQAQRLYLRLYEQEPQTPFDIVTMLRNDSYIVRTMLGDDGPFPTGVKEKR